MHSTRPDGRVTKSDGTRLRGERSEQAAEQSTGGRTSSDRGDPIAEGQVGVVALEHRRLGGRRSN